MKLLSKAPLFLLRRLTTVAQSDRPDLIELRNTHHESAIVFVHGFSGDARGTWGEFPKYLLNDPFLRSWDMYSYEYPTSLRIDIPNFWTADPDITTVADAFRTRCNHGVLSGYRALAVLAHSMGGLVVQKALVDDEGLAQRTTNLFFFGTPSAGLIKAQLAQKAKSQARDMSAGGEFVTKLRRDWETKCPPSCGIATLSIAGRLDTFVPGESAFAPFEPSQQRTILGDHVQIVKPTSAADLSVRIVVETLRGGAAPAGKWDSAYVAAEFNDFRNVVRQLEPVSSELDDDAAILLAMSYDALGRNDDALALLEHRKANGQMTSEQWSSLGGRHKRRWLLQRSSRDLENALYAYGQGLSLATKSESATNADQAMYASINLAFLELHRIPSNEALIPDAAQEYARSASRFADKARQDAWQLATRGEALLYEENIIGACSEYRTAIQLAKTQRDIDSMFVQSSRVAERIGGQKYVELIERSFDQSNPTIS